MNKTMASHEAKPVKVTDAALIIRFSRLYREGMSARELYDATRGMWRIGPRRECPVCACGVPGLVREVYEIHEWLRASRFYAVRIKPRHQDQPSWTLRVRWADSRAPARYVNV